MNLRHLQYGFFSVLLLLLFAQVSFGQVPPAMGAPPFTTMAVEPDQVDLGNLNVHLSFPIVSKPGRGEPFTYRLGFNGPTYTPVSQSWSFDQLLSAEGTAAVPSIANQIEYGTCRTGGYTKTVQDWVYTDGFGVAHPFPGFASYDGCTRTWTPLSAMASDGSGYSLYASTDVFASVTTPSGEILSTTSAGRSTVLIGDSPSRADSNGNYVSAQYSLTPTKETYTDTLGATALSITGGGTSASPYQFTYFDTSGTQQIVTANFTTYTVQSNFGCPNSIGFGPWSFNLISSIVFPDGSSYSFTYEPTPGYPGDVTGRLGSITLRTGGTITYTYTGPNDGTNCADGSTIGLTRTTPDGTTSYTRTQIFGSSSTEWETVVADAQGNQTQVWFQQDNQTEYQIPLLLETKRQVYQGSSTLLQTVQTCYNGSAPDCTATAINVPITKRVILTQLPSGSQKESIISYNAAGLVTETDDYDWGSNPTATLLRKTVTSYASLGNNIQDRPSTVTVYNASSQVAQTTYSYDEGTLTSTSGLTPPVPHHSAFTGSRGNQTTISRWLNTTGGTISTHKTYDDTGNVLTVTDPRNNVTQYSYADNFQDGINRSTLAYLTQTTMPSTSSPNPSTHIVSAKYDFNTGLMRSLTDQNNNTTSYTFDLMLRPTNVTYPSPDGGQTNFYYANTTTVEQQNQMDATRWTDSFIYSDGLGRESRRMSVNDEALPYDQVDTCYDADGRVGFKSYPYQGNGTSTPKVCSGAGDSFIYDALGRVTQVTHSDGTTVLTSYTGRATSVQDEGNGTQRVQRISQVDGLGRLVSLCEVANATQLGSGGTPVACGQDIAGTGFLATYGYDALSNLTSVSQGGYLPRTFTYDSLSRLVCAANPEIQVVTCPNPDTGSYTAGTIRYSYDINGNVTSKIAPKPSQSSTSVTVTATMTYDQLNRIRTKTYANSDNSTTYLAPSVTFNYDETSALGVSGLLNTDGRNSSSVVAGSQAGEIFSYDKLGRVKINSQCTPLNCSTPAVFPINYTYDLLGDTLTATNGFGVTLTYGAYNRALRITGMTSSLSDSNHPGTLYSSPHYNAAGSVVSASIGNTGSSVNETRTYDGRLRLATITDGSVYNVSIPSNGGYAPDSDILLANDSVNGNWTYGYDAFNRLASASVTGQAYTYAYDRFGNRWQQNGPHSSQPGFDANNHIVGLGVTYDAAGNVTNDGTTAYTYDSENRIITATNSTSGAFGYLYDADGRRIRKTIPGNILLDYLYDLSGREMTQVTATGSWYRGEVYAGERHIATYFNSTTYFNFSDWLGTERARSLTGTSSTCETVTSLPFGDGQATTGSCGDPSPMHFTGKERDAESSLDNFGARYNSSQYGRFMSPDPDNVSGLMNQDDPQSWNGYAYVRNNPLNLTDPDGQNYTVCQYDSDGNKTNCADLTDEQYNQYRQQNSNVNSTASGDLYVTNPDGSETKVGNASYYNEKDVAAAQQITQFGPPIEFLGEVEAAAFFAFGARALEGTEPTMSLRGGSPYGTAGAVDNLKGASRKEADIMLRAENPARVHTTAGGYTEYRFADGSSVWIRPNGEVIRVPAPGTAGPGFRVGPDGNLTNQHSTGEMLRN